MSKRLTTKNRRRKLAQRRGHAKRRQRMARVESRSFDQDEQTFFDNYWGKVTCPACRRRYSSKNKRSIDHVRPISAGGRDVPQNKMAICVSCNSSKGAKRFDDWARTKKFIHLIALWNGYRRGIKELWLS